MSDLTIFDSSNDRNNEFLSNPHPEWKLRVNEVDSELADIRTYHFDSEDEAKNLAAGILVSDPCTDLSIFHKEAGEWSAQKINKFDLFDDLDDYPNPIAVGQLLPNLAGQVDPDIIWDLTTGDFDAVERIEDLGLREKADRIMDRLDGAKAWDEEIEIPSIEFEHCDRCGYDTLHQTISSLLGEKLACSTCGNTSAGVYRI